MQLLDDLIRITGQLDSLSELHRACHAIIQASKPDDALVAAHDMVVCLTSTGKPAAMSVLATLQLGFAAAGTSWKWLALCEACGWPASGNGPAAAAPDRIGFGRPSASSCMSSCGLQVDALAREFLQDLRARYFAAREAGILPPASGKEDRPVNAAGGRQGTNHAIDGASDERDRSQADSDLPGVAMSCVPDIPRLGSMLPLHEAIRLDRGRSLALRVQAYLSLPQRDLLEQMVLAWLDVSSGTLEMSADRAGVSRRLSAIEAFVGAGGGTGAGMARAEPVSDDLHDHCNTALARLWERVMRFMETAFLLQGRVRPLIASIGVEWDVDRLCLRFNVEQTIALLRDEYRRDPYDALPTQDLLLGYLKRCGDAGQAVRAALRVRGSEWTDEFSLLLWTRDPILPSRMEDDDSFAASVPQSVFGFVMQDEGHEAQHAGPDFTSRAVRHPAGQAERRHEMAGP